MRPNALLLILLGMNGRVFLVFALGLYGNIISSLPEDNKGLR